MATAKRRYVRAADRELDLVDPLDYLILAQLPNQGELMGGYYPVVTTVRDLKKRHFPQLGPSAISGRLRSMELVGLTMPVKVGGGGGGSSQRGWQITKKGKAVLAEWQQRQKQ